MEVLEKVSSGGSNGRQAAVEVPSASVSSEADETKPASWWAQFIFSGAPIPQGDAILALRSILSELRIAVDEQALSFRSDPVSQGTFVSTLEQLSGSDLGWRTLVQIYEREQQRADNRSGSSS